MQTSNSIGKLSTALCKAQSEMKNPAFDAQNPHFRSKYASLVSVREAVLPVLNKHGLSLSQYPKASPGFAGCVNVLAYDSGEHVIEECLLPLDKQTAHGAGSCITYARRYSLQSIAGVVADEDDDANAAVEKSAPRGSAAEVMQDDFTKLPKAKQQVILDTATQIADYMKENRVYDAFALGESIQDDTEKSALWGKISAPHRSALKKFAAQSHERAELATQP